MNKLFAVAALLALAGCADDSKDYDAAARCQSIGETPGTQQYDNCVREERAGRLMEQQRRDYEQMKQQQEDWRQRRF